MMADSPAIEEVAAVRASAECLVSSDEVDVAIEHMAVAISADLGEQNPIVIGVMTGAVNVMGALLNKLDFPLETDYVHLTRYQGKTSGGETHWERKPTSSVRDRVVLIVDDVLDHGITLQKIVAACDALGAQKTLCAVLVTKDLPNRAGLQRADYSALTLPNRYLFGYGMDYKGYLRNAPGIFALAE